MASVLYPAIVQQAERGYRVIFPDLPGCAASGSTMQEAEMDAEDALSAYLTEAARSGEPTPAPSWMGSIGHEPNINEIGVVLVRAGSFNASARGQETGTLA